MKFAKRTVLTNCKTSSSIHHPVKFTQPLKHIYASPLLFVTRIKTSSVLFARVKNTSAAFAPNKTSELPIHESCTLPSGI